MRVHKTTRFLDAKLDINNTSQGITFGVRECLPAHQKALQTWTSGMLFLGKKGEGSGLEMKCLATESFPVGTIDNPRRCGDP